MSARLEADSNKQWRLMKECVAWTKGDVVKISKNEFLFVQNSCSGVGEHSLNGIQKYNQYNNEWDVIIRYPAQRIFESLAVVYDRINNKLFVADNQYSITIINLNSKSLQLEREAIDNDLFSNVGYPGIVIVNNDNNNNDIHMIGGYSNTKHVIYKQNGGTFQTMYDFKQEMPEIAKPALIYVASKQIILMIGGEADLSCYDDYEEEIGILHNIWKYSIITNKWFRLNIKIDFYAASAVLSSNEKYVIIAAGYELMDNEVNKMFVLEIHDDDSKYILKKTSICTPMKGEKHMVIMGGNKTEKMLVIGWIKQLFKLPQFKDIELPSMDLINIITDFHDQEMVHCIEKKDDNGLLKREHFTIPLNHILHSLV